VASGLGWSGQPIPNPGSHTMYLETRAEHDHGFVPEQQRRGKKEGVRGRASAHFRQSW